MGKTDLSKAYEPSQVEEKWVDFWLDNGSFIAASDQSKTPFSIVIPPPNVTGTLHMGHALNITLQDILCRYKRQKGYNVLWVPGTDHAGIATQNVVEKALANEGKRRQDLGREEFVNRVWQWKEEYGDKILNQIKRMGASVDWSRLRFTMDEGLSKAVREVFVRLYEQGLIYQGSYIINWCPRCQTALADLEVEHFEEKGKLYYIRYPLVEGDGEVIIATTRPETMLGDTAVAVHPEDKKHMSFIGKEIRLPLVGRKIPIIGDPYVEKEFGTGCLKVTPAHDPNDFDLGMKHNLESIKIIDNLGVMTEESGEPYQGLDRFSCRKKVVQDLKDQGYLVKIEDYLHKVGHCYRCQTVIEPLVSKQWFVATKELAKKAKQAVEKGDTLIFPSNWNNLYFDWLDNIREWCISRQIWWGHRIPAWTCQDCGQIIVSRTDPDRCFNCHSAKLDQEEDVLDTWFSSALWPFSTLGWPENTKDLEVFYPTSVLVTGFDIIFFWVARMMMTGIHFMGEVPFKHVYIHALVRDEDGQKMSKSTGNVIDPLVMIERYGADALRFTLTAFAAMGRDVKLSEARIQGYKHFINKIWNTARFALLNLGEEDDLGFDLNKVRGFANRYILHEIEMVKQDIVKSLEGYYFNESAQRLYQFLWHNYCDWYLEMIKQDLYSNDPEMIKETKTCLYITFTEILILLHPFIPFVTQEIWSQFPQLKEMDLSRLEYPESRPDCLDYDLPEQMDFFQQVVVSVRNIRSELNLNPGQKLRLMIKTEEPEAGFLKDQKPNIMQLARLEEMEIYRNLEPPKAAASAVVKGAELYVPLQGVVDFQAELERLNKQLNKLNKDFQGLQKKLENQNFLSKAPTEVVNKEKSRVEELKVKKQKIEQLRDRLDQFVE